MTIGIYCVENKINHKKYIGKAKNIESRFKKHLCALIGKYHYNKYFQRAFNKYGIDNFYLWIIEECSEKDLYKKEKFYIKKFKTNNPKFGYNNTEGGREHLGIKIHPIQ